jgi:hypothetical protein
MGALFIGLLAAGTIAAALLWGAAIEQARDWWC